VIKNIVLLIQIILSIALTILVLIQVKGTGIGRTFGGGSVSFTRRGLEKAVFRFTFIIGFLFMVAAIIELLV
jgi:protein translocase SecG subunit